MTQPVISQSSINMNFSIHSAKFEQLFRETQQVVVSGPVTGKNVPGSIAALKGLIDKMELCAQSQQTGGYALRSKVQKYWVDVKALELEFKKKDKLETTANQALERDRLLGGVTHRKPEIQMDMEAELAYRESFKQANLGLDGLLDSQREALSTLKSNRNALKGIKKRALDAASTLGMGATVIRLIEKRSEQDMVIFFGGCAVVLILLFLLLVYFR